MKGGRCLVVAATVLLLAGCRIELYSGLPEEDANQMLAILMQHHIDADKQRGEGGITLRVDQAHFINAVELLRLNGFPHRKYTTAETMFPPNQLVVSPNEEQQKILYLKEQRIEGMLSQMEGVVQADVAIASHSASGEGEAAPISVAVFIKYSPQVNMEIFRMQIRSLVENAIPGLHYDHISILMQPASYRIAAPTPGAHQDPQGRAIHWLIQHYRLLMIPLALTLLAMMYLAMEKWRQRRR